MFYPSKNIPNLTPNIMLLILYENVWEAYGLTLSCFSGGPFGLFKGPLALSQLQYKNLYQKVKICKQAKIAINLALNKQSNLMTLRNENIRKVSANFCLQIA